MIHVYSSKNTYVLWHKTQRPDLEFYWDKILERLEAQQISLQGIRDWGKTSGRESMRVPQYMDKRLVDGVKIFLQLKTQQLSLEIYQSHDQGVSALLQAAGMMGS